MTIPPHTLTIESHRHGTGYKAACSCGKSIDVGRIEEARERHAAHLQRELGPESQMKRDIERCENCVGDFRCIEHNQEIKPKEITSD